MPHQHTFERSVPAGRPHRGEGVVFLDQAEGRAELLREQCRNQRRERTGRIRFQDTHRRGPRVQGADGRRQIVDFAGDVFGLETGDVHSFSAEAITDCKILCIKRSALVWLARRDTDVARQLWAMTAEELQRAQDHNMLLIKSALQRVAGFLLEMPKRSAVTAEIEPPMSRRDIGDYLGLTLETVSRALSLFQKGGAIAVPNVRRIVLRKRAALMQLNT